MEEYKIERLSEANFPKFHRLFCEVFEANTSFDFLYKKYDTTYLGGDFKYMGFLAMNKEGEAVSYCGTIPFALRIKGKSYMGAHSCDHMTRKDARKKGLFIKLNNCSDALCKQLGIAIVFGFPNQNNHPILVKYANWMIVDTTQVFEIPIKNLPISSIIQRTGLFQTYYSRYVKGKIRLKKSETYIDRKKWNGIMRDKAFYDYKSYTPNYTLQFNHGKVWLKVKGAIFIGDIVLSESSHFLNLMAELKNFARQIGVRKIIFIASSNLNITQLFAEHYIAKKGNGIGIKLLQEGLDIDMDQLHFTLGDYDTF